MVTDQWTRGSTQASMLDRPDLAIEQPRLQACLARRPEARIAGQGRMGKQGGNEGRLTLGTSSRPARAGSSEGGESGAAELR
jgi:hypothetical protein